jgi:pimeloyl-ACP methyl ester carboxylesterase
VPDVAAFVGLPVAVAAVDGGSDSYWHRRADGTDALSMLLEEFMPMVRRMFPALPQALMGWSMGGYSAVLAAERSPASFVAVTPPALLSGLPPAPRPLGHSTAQPTITPTTCSRAFPSCSPSALPWLVARRTPSTPPPGTWWRAWTSPTPSCSVAAPTTRVLAQRRPRPTAGDPPRLRLGTFLRPGHRSLLQLGGRARLTEPVAVTAFGMLPPPWWGVLMAGASPASPLGEDRSVVA